MALICELMSMNIYELIKGMYTIYTLDQEE